MANTEKKRSFSANNGYFPQKRKKSRKNSKELFSFLEASSAYGVHIPITKIKSKKHLFMPN